MTQDEKIELMRLIKKPNLTPDDVSRLMYLSKKHTASSRRYDTEVKAS